MIYLLFYIPFFFYCESKININNITRLFKSLRQSNPTSFFFGRGPTSWKGKIIRSLNEYIKFQKKK